MSVRKMYVLVSFAALALVAAVAVVLAVPVLAQMGGGTALKVATMPRLSELWEVSLTYPGATWEHMYDEPTGQSHWWLVFEVPSTGPRPVWTDIDSINPMTFHTVDEDHAYNVQFITEFGAMYHTDPSGIIKWIRFPRTFEVPQQVALNKEPQNGVILEPGLYRVEVIFSGYDNGPWVITDPAAEVAEHGFRLVAYRGYWAQP